MAAIKRSQANQRRRNPDCILTLKSSTQGMQMGPCQDQTLSPSSCVKVDLQHLIVSILDDPVVSRVFNDAGLSSFDVKLAVLSPFQGLYRYPDLHLSRVRFPFLGSWDDEGEGEYRRVVELLRRKKGRNPLLVGVCANEMLKGFVGVLERRQAVVLPEDICGMDVVSIEGEFSNLANPNVSYEAIDLRFKEVGMMVEKCLGPGLMVNIGDVTSFLGKEEEGCKLDVVNRVVRELTQLLKINGERVWLIASALNDQIYVEFMSRFPLIDKEWDLQPLPITYIKSSIGESCFKSTLMRSFVPFGGFFSTPPDPKTPFNTSIQRNLLDGKHLRDVTSLSKRAVVDSVADLRVDTKSDHLKAKCGHTVIDAPRNSLDFCQDKNQNRPNFCSKKCDSGMITPCASVDVQKHWTSQSSKQAFQEPLTNHNFLDKLSRSPSKSQHLCSDGPCSSCSLCISDVDDGPSGVSVATDLGLDIFSHVSKQENACHLANKCSNHSLNIKTLFKDLLGRVGRQSEALGVVSQIVAQSWLSDGSHQRSNQRGDIWLEFVGPDIIGKRRTALALAEVLFGNKKYFIQVNFGSEYVVVHQKKVCGYQITNSFDAKSRGKTVVDHIAEELHKTPFSVVLLENVHFADPVAQRSLLQAIRDGKFSDSHGREISLTNRIFVLTSRLVKDSSIFFPESRIEKTRGGALKLVIKDTGDYETNQNLSKVGPEKDIPNQYLLCKRKLSNTHETIWPHKGSMSSMCMDLNLPAQAIEEVDYIGDADEAYECKNGMSWLDELADEGIDKTLIKVRFDPFDYDAVAANILRWVHAAFGEVTNSKCVLEIEPRAMDQILVAACLTRADQDVRDWVDGVLSKSFAEALKAYQLTSHTIVMLATCDGDTLHMVDQISGFCLPSKVNVT